MGETGARSDRFQILSIDGGGIKGIYAAAVLASIEEDLGGPIQKHFDLIAGTSTGGIITLGLGLGLRSRELLDFYVEKGPKIFRNRARSRGVLHWFHRKYPQQPLADALQEAFGESLLGESSTRLVVPSYNLDEEDVHIFKTPHHQRYSTDWKVPAWQVALATSAAPTYFESCRHIDDMRLIDGGVWANNPSMVALTDATQRLGVPMESVRVLSIGTSSELNHRPDRLTSGGKIGWARSAAAIDVILRAQSVAAWKQTVCFLTNGNSLRIDPTVPAGLFSLDGVASAPELIAKARYASRQQIPDVRSIFADHLAEPYIPVYGPNMKDDTK